MAPYVSSRRLSENSLAGMLAAIEIYNKPQISYRDETCVILVVNAWELLLKGVLRKAGGKIFYPKEGGKPYRSLTLKACLDTMADNKLWPESVDGSSVRSNLEVLVAYRDQATHLYPAKNLGSILHLFLQQNILNYRSVMMSIFKKNLADHITWELLPLGAQAPTEDIQFMFVNASRDASPATASFLRDLRSLIQDAEATGADMGQVVALYRAKLTSAKKISAADFEVSVTKGAGATVFEKKMDPNESHPFGMMSLLAKVNERRTGRVLTQYDIVAKAHIDSLRSDPQLAWKDAHTGTTRWSGTALVYFSKLSDDDYDEARQQYQESLRKHKKHSVRSQ